MTNETLWNGFSLIITGLLIVPIYWLIGWEQFPGVMFVCAGLTLWIGEFARRTYEKKAGAP